MAFSVGVVSMLVLLSGQVGAAERPTAPAAVAVAAAVPKSATCAVQFHTRLAADVLPLARETETIAAELGSMSLPDLPGAWLFWDGFGVAQRTAYQQRRMATPLVDRAGGRVCSRQILARGGRIRCLAWRPLPENDQPAVDQEAEPATLEITTEERQMAASLMRRVSHRGGFPELQPDAALYHTVKRATDELIAFASQPLRETLCTGVREMVGFYRGQLEPLRGRVVAARRTLARTLGNARSGTQGVQLPAASDSAREDRASASIDREGLDKAVRAHLEPHLSQAEFASLPATVGFAFLARLRELLAEERLLQMAEDEQGALRKALRNAEFAVYAAHDHHHLGRLSARFQSAMDGILDAHRSACECNSASR